MTSIADGSVKIQTTSESNLSPPSWFGEVVLLIGYLRKHGVLSKISEQVRFARRRFGRYEVIDFLAVLSATPSVENAPWRLSTSGSSPLRSPSWHFLTVTSSPLARLSRAF